MTPTTRERIKEILLAAKDGHPADALLRMKRSVQSRWKAWTIQFGR